MKVFSIIALFIFFVFVGYNAGAQLDPQYNTFNYFLYSLPFNTGVTMTLLYLLSFGVALVFFHLTIVFQILMHEVGHLLGGLLTGYRFISFRVGKHTWIKKDGRLRRKQYTIGGSGGQCLMEPPDIRGKAYRFPFVLYNIGGCVMNLLLVILLFVLRQQTSGIISTMLLWCAIHGLILFAINLIPMKLGGISNDGHNLWLCAVSKKARRALWIQLKYAAMATQGTRTRDIPEPWHTNIGDITNALVGFLPYLHYDYLMDTEDGSAARAYAQQILTNPGKMLPVHLYIFQFELLFHELINENRADTVEEMYTKKLKAYLKASKTHLFALRLQYAYTLLYLKDEQKAQSIFETFDKTCALTPFSGEVANERFWIEKVRSCSHCKNMSIFD